ncbi:hypothetical protein PPERSA_06081 [Pseudocohnilembus persalinus]|uniref:Uncharacterized protein n=1 Tax=Pseudocohnilembus persalinus TaxID=266149 RepID=A0A0V0QVB3_PSEPJ|nr:hypothetical protein PPERSA_06081 [Pseudocohnilembus persalinus]|eukprot:KRX06199.1 hypothetical protein PPERSA_06081 [Pseudocohnilembus persalinus]
MSSENKEDIFLCHICVQQKYFEQKEIQQKSQKTLIVDQLQSEKPNNENVFGWRPIQDENHQEIFQNSQKILKEYGLESDSFFNFFKQMINDFYNNFKEEIFKLISKQQKETINQLQTWCNNYFQNENSDKEFNQVQKIIKQFDIKDFKQKFQDFEQKKIDIDQLFDYKQQQNCNVYNNNEIYATLENQHKPIEKLKQDLEKEFAKINESVDSFKNYQPNLKATPKKQQQQQLKFYKSDFGQQNSLKGILEINNDARTIKFKKNQWWFYIYSENLQQKKDYHLRFTMDTKNNQEDIYLAFSLTSGDQKNSKELETDHYVRVFNYNSNSYAKGGEVQVEGKQNFFEFFKDNQTILNVVFNIENKMLEIYDDDRISYQRLNFKNNSNNFDEWILGIRYCLGNNNNQDISIQFID